MHPLSPGHPLPAENPWAAGKCTETTYSIEIRPKFDFGKGFLVILRGVRIYFVGAIRELPPQD